MCWINVENRCKELYDDYLTNGKKPIERKAIVRVIADEFPEIPRLRVGAAVDRCVLMCQEPINSTVFVTFMQGLLK